MPIARHELLYAQSARQGSISGSISASRGSLSLVGVAYEALMAFRQLVRCMLD